MPQPTWTVKANDTIRNFRNGRGLGASQVKKMVSLEKSPFYLYPDSPPIRSMHSFIRRSKLSFVPAVLIVFTTVSLTSLIFVRFPGLFYQMKTVHIEHFGRSTTFSFWTLDMIVSSRSLVWCMCVVKAATKIMPSDGSIVSLSLLMPSVCL